jgi:hypothetical protein
VNCNPFIYGSLSKQAIYLKEPPGRTQVAASLSQPVHTEAERAWSATQAKISQALLEDFIKRPLLRSCGLRFSTGVRSDARSQHKLSATEDQSRMRRSAVVTPCKIRPLFDRASGYPTDEAIEKHIVGDRHRDAGDQGAGHDLAPVEDVAADEIGRHAKRDRLLIRC